MNVASWFRRWWPMAASVAAAATVATLMFVATLAVEERQQLRDQRDQLAELVEIQRRADAERVARFAATIIEVEEIVTSLLDQHHDDIARKVLEVQAQLESLGARPVPPTVVVREAPTTATTEPTTTTTERCRGRNCNP